MILSCSQPTVLKQFGRVLHFPAVQYNLSLVTHCPLSSNSLRTLASFWNISWDSGSRIETCMKIRVASDSLFADNESPKWFQHTWVQIKHFHWKAHNEQGYSLPNHEWFLLSHEISVINDMTQRLGIWCRIVTLFTIYVMDAPPAWAIKYTLNDLTCNQTHMQQFIDDCGPDDGQIYPDVSIQTKTWGCQITRTACVAQPMKSRRA